MKRLKKQFTANLSELIPIDTLNEILDIEVFKDKRTKIFYSADITYKFKKLDNKGNITIEANFEPQEIE